MKDVLEITRDLVAIRTTEDRSDELMRAINYCFDSCCNDLFFRRYEKNNKPSLVISNHEGLDFDVLLVGHLDVVPAKAELFVPRIEGDIMYGRGVCDMKSECAVMLKMMNEISEQKTDKKIALMLTTDEEIGGFDGVNYLLNEIGYTTKVAIVPDGGTAPHELVVANKGLLTLRLTAKGKRAHGSRPWLGENAIDKIINAYIEIQTLFSMEATKENKWVNTCNIGSICGGVTSNQVPDFARCDLDIRFTESTNSDELYKQVNSIASEYDCAVETRILGNPMRLDEESSSAALFKESVEKTTQHKTKLLKFCGSNDGRFFADKGIPVIITRPRSGDQHSSNEWLDITSLTDFENVLRYFIQNHR